jgi:hypothetical protein
MRCCACHAEADKAVILSSRSVRRARSSMNAETLLAARLV